MRKLIVVGCLLVSVLAAGLISDKPALAATTKVLIAGGRTTSPWYALSQALAKFINDKSSWLRAEVVSTAGITGDLDMLKSKPKEYIGISSFSHIHYRPGHEWGEKRGTYTGERFIANAIPTTNVFVTYDPKIKTVKDLAGKTVDVGRRGAANTPDHKAILKAYGILDKVKFVYTGYGGGAAKLKDGLVDATVMLINHTYPANFSKGGFIDKLETKGPIYYVGFDRDKLLALREKEFATAPVWIPGGALDPKTQPKGLWAYIDPLFFSADKDMDEKVVYEVARIIWETPIEKWTAWHPMGANMARKFLPGMPSLKLYQPHPGAKKFYDEKGVKVADLADLIR